MKYMTTKEYLGQLLNIDRRIKDKLSESQKWIDIAYGRSIGQSKEIKHDVIQMSYESNDKIADAVAKSIDYYNDAVRMSKEMVEIKHTLEEQIDSISEDRYYNVLHSYYIDEKSLQQIADDEHYSYKSIKRRYESAISHFEDRYGAEYLNVVRF